MAGRKKDQGQHVNVSKQNVQSEYRQADTSPGYKQTTRNSDGYTNSYAGSSSRHENSSQDYYQNHQQTSSYQQEEQTSYSETPSYNSDSSYSAYDNYASQKAENTGYEQYDNDRQERSYQTYDTGDTAQTSQSYQSYDNSHQSQSYQSYENASQPQYAAVNSQEDHSYQQSADTSYRQTRDSYKPQESYSAQQSYHYSTDDQVSQKSLYNAKDNSRKYSSQSEQYSMDQSYARQQEAAQTTPQAHEISHASVYEEQSHSSYGQPQQPSYQQAEVQLSHYQQRETVSAPVESRTPHFPTPSVSANETYARESRAASQASAGAATAVQSMSADKVQTAEQTATVKGTTSEDLAANKSQAKVETSSGKWKAENSSTPQADYAEKQVSSASKVHNENEEQKHTSYHTDNDGRNDHFSAVNEEETVNASLNAKATDTLGRSVNTGAGLNSGSPLENGMIRFTEVSREDDRRKRDEDARNARVTAQQINNAVALATGQETPAYASESDDSPELQAADKIYDSMPDISRREKRNSISAHRDERKGEEAFQNGKRNISHRPQEKPAENETFTENPDKDKKESVRKAVVSEENGLKTEKAEVSDRNSKADHSTVTEGRESGAYHTSATEGRTNQVFHASVTEGKSSQVSDRAKASDAKTGKVSDKVRASQGSRSRMSERAEITEGNSYQRQNKRKGAVDTSDKVTDRITGRTDRHRAVDRDDGRFERQKTSDKNKKITPVDVSKTHGMKYAVKKVTVKTAESTESAVRGSVSESDAAQGKHEVTDDMKRVAFLTGGTAIGHAVVREGMRSDITQRGKAFQTKITNKVNGVKVTSKVHTALGRGIDAAESSTGLKYVKDGANSYGSVAKDIRNNLQILDSYFLNKGLDIRGYSKAQLKHALSIGKLTNRAGKDVFLSREDKALIKEKIRMMDRKRALQAAGSWHEDAAEFLGDMYKDSDTYEGYKAGKTAVKAGKTTVKAGKGLVKGAVNGAVDVVAGIPTVINGTIRAGVNVVGGIGGIGNKNIRKWRADTSARYKAKNAKIHVRAGKVKGGASAVIDDGLGIAARGTGKLIKKAAGATVGRTRFGKFMANGGRKTVQVKNAFHTWRMGVQKRIKDNKAVQVVSKPFKALGKGIEKIGKAVNIAKIVAIVMCLILLASSTIIIVLTASIASVTPAGADKDTFADGQETLWEQSKDGINDQLEAIASDCESWVNNNYRALRKKRRGGKDLIYGTDFVFNGFEFDGPTNNVTDREVDQDAVEAYQKAMQENATSGDSEVPDGTTAAHGPLAGSTPRTQSKSKGRNYDGPSGEETWYNGQFRNIVNSLDKHAKGSYGLSDSAHYFVRSDGVRMYGDENGVAYVMIAANLNVRPKGTVVMTSLGPGIVCDECRAADTNPRQIDIAVTWHTDGPNDSGVVDTTGAHDYWNSGASVGLGGGFVDGKKACSQNYLRSILAMVTTATGNEEDPKNYEFYTNYCKHLVKNSWNYTKYVAANKWKKDHTRETILAAEDDPTLSYDDPYADSTAAYGGASFDIQVMDKDYTTTTYTDSDGNSYTATRLSHVTYAVTCRFLNCGLWGEKDWCDENDTDTIGVHTGKPAGTGDSPDRKATSVGMFDVETYKYDTTDMCGDKVENEICDDEYIHKLAKTGSDEYDEQNKNAKDYNAWDGWEDEGDVDGVGPGIYIYESGSNTSNVEGTYDLEDEDYADMGVSFDGIYNIDHTNSDDGGSGGKCTSKPLTDAEIEKYLQYAQNHMTGDSAPERLSVLRKGLELCGKVHYEWGGQWNSSTTDQQVMSRGLDCAAFVSYIAYKGGARNCGFSSTVHTAGFAPMASSRPAHPSRLKPGDIFVKRGKYNDGHDSKGNYASHAVMILGQTDQGFAIIEESGSKGAHLSFYKSQDDFVARRGGGADCNRYWINLFGDDDR